MSITNVTTAAPTVAPTHARAAGKAYAADAAKLASTPARADRAELTQSGELQRLVELAKGGDVRADKVAALKAEIASGNYDLDAKADAVADRLLDDLGL